MNIKIHTTIYLSFREMARYFFDGLRRRLCRTIAILDGSILLFNVDSAVSDRK